MALNVQKVKWGHMTKPPFAPVHGTDSQMRQPNSPTVPAGRAGAVNDEFAAWVLSPAARVPKASTRAGLQAVLFDLDGVLVDTAEFHYQAWQRLADELGIVFDRERNDHFRGVGRMECLDRLLGIHGRLFVAEEKRLLAERKNEYYLEQVKGLTPRDLAPGAWELAEALRGLSEGGVRLAVVSASRNARLVVDLLKIADWFGAIVDGADVTRGKPDPQGFLLAAERLRVLPERCVVIEDAEAGIRAGRAAGMMTVGVGEAAVGAEAGVGRIQEVTMEMLEKMLKVTG